MMLQTYSASQPRLYEDRDQALDLTHFIAIFRRRIFYFAVPFVLFLIIGFLIVAIQRPIYHAEGKILVESPEIPTNLVQPTVTAAATERIQVIQQRLMSRDNLLPIVNKFGLFPSQQKWMSGTELLDLMRERAEIHLVDIETMMNTGADGKPVMPRPNDASNAAVAFTVSFEYEDPELAMKVANELLTSILSEDVRARTDRATETSEFLSQEVKRLQDKLDVVDAQIVEFKRKVAADPTLGTDQAPDQLKLQMNALTAMKEDLIQKSSVYSAEHPAVKALKKRIAALEHDIAEAAKANPPPPQGNDDIYALAQQQTSLENDLDIASKKLIAARLGETMERNQQAEHLEVIEQPIVPQKPVKPKRLKLFAMAFGLAAMAGIGGVFLVETLDKTIRGRRELAGIVDSHLLVVIPYISTAREIRQMKRRIVLLWAALAIALLAGLAAAIYIGIAIDFSWVDRSWIDSLTRLTK
jgi:uncharacterized protein involved in exopolysaccharide biosynthesis